MQDHEAKRFFAWFMGCEPQFIDFMHKLWRDELDFPKPYHISITLSHPMQPPLPAQLPKITKQPKSTPITEQDIANFSKYLDNYGKS